MQVAIVIALIVVVAALLWVAVQQDKAIKTYEKELLKKSKKTTAKAEKAKK